MPDLEQHAARLLELVTELEQDPRDDVRNRVLELLDHIDHLHRSSVWRLFELMTELGGKGLVDRITADATVRMLFMLYDLLPVDPVTPVRAELHARPAGATGFIPLGHVGNRRRTWKVAFARREIRPGTLSGVEVDGVPVLLVALDEGLYAYRNACGRGVLPLHLGALADPELRCPWHGCRYEARTGRRLDNGGGPDLETFPVRLEGDQVLVSTV